MDPKRTATRLLTAGTEDIIRTLGLGGLSLDELRRIESALFAAKRRAEAGESSRRLKTSPADLAAEAAGNWGCYDHKDTPKAVAALNKLGAELVEAIRGASGDESYPAIRSAMQAIVKKQRVWSRTGAADTEGREAIWSVVQAACAGTDLDPDSVWDNCY